MLQLLVRLLADPARLDRRHERASRRVRRQVAEVVFALAARSPLAHQPDLFAGQVPRGPGDRPVAHADADGREALGERALGPPPPGHPAPPGRGQHVFDGPRRLARHRCLARPPPPRPRPAQPNRGGVDLLVARDAHRPEQLPLVQPAAERGARAIAGIRQHGAEPHARGPQPVQLGQRDLALAPGLHLRRGHAGPGAPPGLGGPLLRQEQAQTDRDGHLAPGQGQRDQCLAVRPLAQRSAVLPRHANRQVPLLRQGGVVDHQHRLRPAQQPVRALGQHPPQRAVVPGRAGDEVVQLVVPRQAEPGRHGLQALALARAHQAAQVKRRPGPALLVPERREEGRQPAIQIAPGAAGFGHRHLPPSRSAGR